MLKPSRLRKQIFLALVDVLILLISIPFSIFLRNLAIPSLISLKLHFFYFLPLAVFWILAMYTAGFYILERPLSSIKRNVLLFIISLLSLGFGFSLFYLCNEKTISPKIVLLLYCFLSLSLILLWRNLYTAIYFQLKKYPNLVFIGYNNTVGELLEFIQGKSYFMYNPIAVFSSREEVSTPIKTIHSAKRLEELFQSSKIDIVVLSSSQYDDTELRRLLFSLLNKRISLFMIQDFYELTTRKIPIDALNDFWLISKIDLNSKNMYLAVKRFFDLFISLFLLIVLSPIMLLVSVLIKITSKGPVFFKQCREGKDSKRFTILKFRTMSTENNDFAPTAEGDARITKLGNFLRKTRIDEIPQMINVLKGEMSFIGPRPERPELSRELEKAIPFYRQRLLVKPGISGWDQVSGEYHSPSVEDTIEKVKHDLYYIKNLSIFLDISIFFKTITTIVKKAGR